MKRVDILKKLLNGRLQISRLFIIPVCINISGARASDFSSLHSPALNKSLWDNCLLVPVSVKLLCFTNWRRIGERIYVRIFSNSALLGGEWSVSRSGRFTPSKKTLVDGPQKRYGRRGEETNLVSTETRTPTSRPSSPQPVAMPTVPSPFCFCFL
jgi:hypothetical protein